MLAFEQGVVAPAGSEVGIGMCAPGAPVMFTEGRSMVPEPQSTVLDSVTKEVTKTVFV